MKNPNNTNIKTNLSYRDADSTCVLALALDKDNICLWCPFDVCIYETWSERSQRVELIKMLVERGIPDYDIIRGLEISKKTFRWMEKASIGNTPNGYAST